jgi:hypothetical protein
VIPAKAMAMTVVDLLANGGAEGKRVVSGARPPLTKQQYLDLLRGLESERTYRDE